MISHHSAEMCSGFDRPRPRTETAFIPSERASQIIIVDVEFDSFDKLETEISWIKGGPGLQTGGTHSDQSGGPLSPGGECFAPCLPATHLYGPTPHNPKPFTSITLQVEQLEAVNLCSTSHESLGKQWRMHGKPSTWFPRG